MLEQRYHLDEPFLVRYWQLADGGPARATSAISIALRQERLHADRASASATTAQLVLYASLIIVVLGIGLGIARRRCGRASPTPA